MRTVSATVSAICVAVGLTAAAPVIRAGDLAVTVSYTGKAPVDDTHEIWVFLFDSPVINNSSTPVAVQAVKKSGDTAALKNVAQDIVYVAMAYDEKGDYDGTAGPPPPGTPIGMYSTDGKAAGPVKPGPGAKIKATFDDARRMGQGQ